MITSIILVKVHRGSHVDWIIDQNFLVPSSSNTRLHFAEALGETKCTSLTLIHGTCSGPERVSSYDTSKGLRYAYVCWCLAHSWSYHEKTPPWKTISGAARTTELLYKGWIWTWPAVRLEQTQTEPTSKSQERESSLVNQAQTDKP